MKAEPESITVRLPKEMKAELEKMAVEQDLTVSQLVRRHFVRVLKPAPRRSRADRKTAA